MNKNISSVDLLPAFYRTDANRKFLKSTLDQLISTGSVKRVSGYIGRQDTVASKNSDVYLESMPDNRTDYQLEPSIIIKDQYNDITLYKDYIDFINQLNAFDGNTYNHDRLNKQEFYAWNPHIDLDKFTNYNSYYWLPDGPPPIRISANPITTQSKILDISKTSICTISTGTPHGLLDGVRITIEGVTELPDSYYVIVENESIIKLYSDINCSIPVNSVNFSEYSDSGVITAYPLIESTLQVKIVTETTYNAFVFAETSTNHNPLLRLVRGRKYRFKIDNPGHPFSIKTTRTLGASDRYNIAGLINNGIESGELIFTVPSDAPDVLFYQNESDINCGGMIHIDSYSTSVGFDVERELVGLVAITFNSGIQNQITLTNGLPITFDSTISPMTYQSDVYFVEGIGNGIRLVNKNTIQPLRSSSYMLTTMGVNNLNGKSILTVSNTDQISIGDIISPNQYFESNTKVLSIIDNTSIYISKNIIKNIPNGIKLIFENINVNTTPDYLVINRASRDKNPWTRANRWFHREIIELCSKINNIPVELDQSARGRRPIIEFEADLKLYNYGTYGSTDIDLIDTFTTDILSNIEGQYGYYIDGVLLQDGNTVLFTQESNSQYNNIVYKVKMIPETTSEYPDAVIIHLEQLDLPTTGKSVMIKSGTQNGGKSYWFNGKTWNLGQDKLIPNSAPLFDLVDRNGISYSDPEVYFGSTFSGSKIFSYKQGSGIDDVVLGFPLQYRNVSNIGDIVFEFNLETDSFEFQNNSVITTQKINNGFLIKSMPSEKTQYTNGWIKSAIQTYQTATRLYRNSSITNNFNLDLYDDIHSLSDLKVKIFVNGVLFPQINWQVLDGPVYKYIHFYEDLLSTDILTIKTHSNQPINTNGFYDIPLSLQHNPGNSSLSDMVLGEVTTHVKSIVSNISEFKGIYPGTNNLRDLPNCVQFGTRFIQHTSPGICNVFHITSESANIIKAIEKCQHDYNAFKREFIISSTTNGAHTDTRPHVDLILRDIIKTHSAAYYFSDMVPCSGAVQNDFYVVDTGIVNYPISSNFNLNSLSTSAVLVYLNGEQLLVNKDYKFDNGFITITKPLSIGQIVSIYEYDSTDGCCVPETPTKMGLWPAYKPELFLDTSLLTPQMMIRGHDGSCTLAYGDYRDDLLLELEKRIYNNIKVSYDASIFDVYDFIPGYYRNTDYSIDEFNRVLSTQFYRWVNFIGGINATNSAFNDADFRTYNFSHCVALNGTAVPGYMHGINRWLFDTTSPQITPWEMLGFSIEPDWWKSQYGPGPYTSNNIVLWNDIANGFIKEPNKPLRVSTKFKRPILFNGVPVTESGQLLDPYTAGFINGALDSSIKDNLTFGDEGPTEHAWRRSSDYPFSIIRTLMLLAPGRILGVSLDRSRMMRNLTDQIVYSDTGIRLTLSDLKIPSTQLDETRIQTCGLINCIANYLIDIGSYSKISEYHNDLNSLACVLGYRLSGFSSKDKFKLILDSKAPSSGGTVYIPDENYTLFLNSSSPIKKMVYSGVVINKVHDGFVISGYNQSTPYFNYYQWVQSGSTITIGGITESYAEWSPTSQYIVGRIVKYSNNFYRVKITHISSQEFNDANFVKLESQPIIGGATAILRKTWDKSTVSTIAYGTRLRTIQDVVDFLQGYSEWLSGQGWIFDTYNETLSQLENWETSIKEFLFWTTQNWSSGSQKWTEWKAETTIKSGDVIRYNGVFYEATFDFTTGSEFESEFFIRLSGLSEDHSSVIALSPGALHLTFNPGFGVVDQLHTPLHDYEIVGVDGTTLMWKYINEYREDENVTYAPVSGAIYGGTFYVVQKEHVLIIDNNTVFNDIIYDPISGNRQERIKVSGYVSTDWDGSFNIPGFIYDQGIIQDWTPWTDYAIGDTVQYKEYYYSANVFSPGKVEFDSTEWVKLNRTPRGQLIPNLSYKAMQFTNVYEADGYNFDAEQERIGQHLIGYQKREYLNNIIQDDVSQYKFYQGMIRDKGTGNVLQHLINSSNQETSLTVHEEWAIRVGQYGASNSYKSVQLVLKDAEFKNNPQGIALVSEYSKSDNLTIQYTPSDVYLKPIGYNSKPFPLYTDYHQYLRSSGHVQYSEIQHTIGSLNELLNNPSRIINFNNGDYIWCTFYKNTWDVFQFISSELNITSMVYDSKTNTIQITTPEIIQVKLSDYIGLGKVSNGFGFYQVKSVILNTITLYNNPSTDFSSPFTESKSAILYNLISRRIETIDDANRALSTTIKAGDRLWIGGDNNETLGSSWVNYPAYSASQIPITNIDHNLQFGACLCISQDGLRLISGSSSDLVLVYSRLNDNSGWTFRQAIRSIRYSTVENEKNYKNITIQMSPNGNWLCVGYPEASHITSGYVGTWNTTTEYKQGNIVKYSGNGKYYKYTHNTPTTNKNPSTTTNSIYWINVPYIDSIISTSNKIVKPGNFIPHSRYIISTLGNTDWNAVCETSGIIYKPGNEIIPKKPGVAHAESGSAAWPQDVHTTNFTNQGLIVLYRLDNKGVYKLIDGIVSENQADGTRFGAQLAFTDNQLFITSIGDSNTNGSVSSLLYDSFTEIWSYSNFQITTNQSQSNFGSILDVSNNALLITEPGYVISNAIVGRVLVFDLIYNTTTQQYIADERAVLIGTSNGFGTGASIADGGEIIAISNITHDGEYPDQGIVNIYKYNHDTRNYNTIQELHPINAEAFGEFGTKLRFLLNGKSLAVYSRYANNNIIETWTDNTIFDNNGTTFGTRSTDSGRIDIFDRYNNNWIYSETLSNTNTSENGYGVGFTTSDQLIVVGSPYTDYDSDLGKVYTFHSRSNGVDVQYPLSDSPVSKLNSLLFLNGELRFDYNIFGSVLILDSIPAKNTDIELIYYTGNVIDTILTEIATNNKQFQLEPTTTISKNTVQVFINGKYQLKDSYVVNTQSNTVTLSSVQAGNIVTIIVFVNNSVSGIKKITVGTPTNTIGPLNDAISIAENILVFVNGIYQSKSSYVIGNAKFLVFDSQLAANSKIEIITTMFINMVGRVDSYYRPIGKFAWRSESVEENKIAVDQIKRVFLYNRLTNQIAQYLDVIDPLVGKISGIADQELSYKTFYDPAVYTNGNGRIDPTMPWNVEHVGELWWDLRTTKFINPYINTSIYRNTVTGILAHGATVDVYEWVSSTISPSEWNSISDSTNGIASGISGIANTDSYTVLQKYDNITKSHKSTYYFWVKNKAIVPQISSRTISALDVAKLIENPRSTGYAYAMFTGESSLSLFNVNSIVDDVNTVLCIEYWDNPVSDGISHSQWKLFSIDTKSTIPSVIETKWFDSLCGKDKYDRFVPDYSLPTNIRYGIENRPRQGMFTNPLEALKNVIEYANIILKQNQITGTRDLSKLKVVDIIPSSTLGLYDRVVSTYSELDAIDISGFIPGSIELLINDGRIHGITVLAKGNGYTLGRKYTNTSWYGPNISISGSGINGQLVGELNQDGQLIGGIVINPGEGYTDTTIGLVRSYGVLVETDIESYNNWAIYEYNHDISSWVRVKNQTYRVQKYWYYIDWYATGYNQYTTSDYVLNHYSDIHTFDCPVGSIIKVQNVNDFGWVLLERVDSTSAELIEHYKIVGEENGTLQFSSELFNYNKKFGYDTSLYDSYLYDNAAYREIRYILEALRDDIFIEDLRVNYLTMFEHSIRYALSEQLFVDWVFKTSFISVLHSVGNLSQSPLYRSDPLESYENFLQEVKPYRTKVRELINQYSTIDTALLGITDFSLKTINGQHVETQMIDGEISIIDNDVPSNKINTWYDNAGFIITGATIITGGSGYTTPTITFVGKCISSAIGKLTVSNGQITQIDIIHPGSGYLTRPEIVITGTSSSPCKAVAILGDSLVRSTAVKLAFDRVSTSYEYNHLEEHETFTGDGSSNEFNLKWSPDIKYGTHTVTINGRVLFDTEYTFSTVTRIVNGSHLYSGKIKFINTPVKSSIIVVDYLKNNATLTAADRIQFLYKPGIGQPGKDLAQVLSGIEPDVSKIDGGNLEYASGWGTAGYGTVMWGLPDKYTDYIIKISNGMVNVELPRVPDKGTIFNSYVIRQLEERIVGDGKTMVFSHTGSNPQVMIEFYINSVGVSKSNIITLDTAIFLKPGDILEFDEHIIYGTQITKILNEHSIELNNNIHLSIPTRSRLRFIRPLIENVDYIRLGTNIIKTFSPAFAIPSYRVIFDENLGPLTAEDIQLLITNEFDIECFLKFVSESNPVRIVDKDFTMDGSTNVINIGELGLAIGDTLLLREATHDGSIDFNDRDTILDGGVLNNIVSELVIDGSTTIRTPEEQCSTVLTEAIGIKVYENDNPYLQFIDFRGNSYFKHLSETNISILAQDLNYGDESIVLVNVSGFNIPDLDNNIPGMVEIGSEIIQYYNIDFDTNTLSNLRRGLFGTSIKTVYRSGTNVLDIGESENIDYQDTTTSTEYTVTDNQLITFSMEDPWVFGGVIVQSANGTKYLLSVNDDRTFVATTTIPTYPIIQLVIGERLPDGEGILFNSGNGIESTVSISDTGQLLINATEVDKTANIILGEIPDINGEFVLSATNGDAYSISVSTDGTIKTELLKFVYGGQWKFIFQNSNHIQYSATIDSIPTDILYLDFVPKISATASFPNNIKTLTTKQNVIGNVPNEPHYQYTDNMILCGIILRSQGNIPHVLKVDNTGLLTVSSITSIPGAFEKVMARQTRTPLNAFVLTSPDKTVFSFQYELSTLGIESGDLVSTENISLFWVGDTLNDGPNNLSTLPNGIPYYLEIPTCNDGIILTDTTTDFYYKITVNDAGNVLITVLDSITDEFVYSIPDRIYSYGVSDEIDVYIGGYDTKQWNPNIEYFEHDLISINNITYECIKSHTSTSFRLDLNNWRLISNDLHLKKYPYNLYHNERGPYSPDSNEYLRADFMVDGFRPQLKLSTTLLPGTKVRVVRKTGKLM